MTVGRGAGCLASATRLDPTAVWAPPLPGAALKLSALDQLLPVAVAGTAATAGYRPPPRRDQFKIDQEYLKIE